MTPQQRLFLAEHRRWKALGMNLLYAGEEFVTHPKRPLPPCTMNNPTV